MKNAGVFLISATLVACATAPVTTNGPSANASGTNPQTAVAAVQPAGSPNRLTPLQAALPPIAEPRIRVGLASDQPSVTFPRTPDGYVLIADERAWSLRRGFTVAAPLDHAETRYAVQVSAISDKSSVDATVERLTAGTGQRAGSVFDPANGLYRILVGDFAESSAAAPLREDLLRRGYGKDMQIVRRPSDQPFEKRLTITDDEGERQTIDAPSLLVMPASGETILIAGKPYRTAARLFINGRGLLNAINELNMEDYLRGVVPAEMGSKVFDEVEALKAQAIAARTYAVRNLKQYGTEGYDICPGPACQAYAGFAGEEPLTTRAVQETAGMVLTYQGKPIDALYTSTCGGETSDVGTMFPARNEPYLKRARCVELEMTTLDGRADSGLLTEQQVTARIFAAVADLPDGNRSWGAREVAAAVDAAARLAGGGVVSASNGEVSSPTSRVAVPSSSRRGDVLQYLAARFSLDRIGRTVTMPEDRTYYFPRTAGAESTAYQAAAFLIKYGMMPAQDLDRIDLNAPMPREELYALLGSWARKHEALREVTGKIAAIDGRNLTLRAEGKSTKYVLPAGLPVFRRLGDRLQEYRSVPVMIGDRGFLQLRSNGTPAALIVSANADGASFDRTSSFASWTRSYRADELVTSINKRNPIRELHGLRPVTIDASQRVAELEVTAEDGRKFLLRGLPVRWSLNVPDNLFVMEKSVDPDGIDRYTFFGKGWGHGVGFCQVGSYGMAFRGFDAVKILKWYYTGVDVVPMSTLAGGR